MALTLEGLGADAIGLNCSLGPREMAPLVEELRRWTTLPLVLKPNAGLPDPADGGYDISPEEFAAAWPPWRRLGVTVFGRLLRHHTGVYRPAAAGAGGRTARRVTRHRPRQPCAAALR